MVSLSLFFIVYLFIFYVSFNNDQIKSMIFQVVVIFKNIFFNVIMIHSLKSAWKKDYNTLIYKHICVANVDVIILGWY